MTPSCPVCGNPMVTRRECVEDDLWEILTRCLTCGFVEAPLDMQIQEENTMVNTQGQSKGEEAVRYTFNPGGNDDVERIKRQTASLIDFCEDLKNKDPHGCGRLVALAQTAYEEAAMWAVKAATTGLE